MVVTTKMNTLLALNHLETKRLLDWLGEIGTKPAQDMAESIIESVDRIKKSIEEECVK